MLKRFFLLAVLTIFPLSAQIELSGLAPLPGEASEPVTIDVSREISKSGDSVSVILTLKMKKEIHIYAAESLFFKVAFIEQLGLDSAIISLPKGKSFTNFDKTVVPVFINEQQIRISGRIANENWSIKGTMQYQACDNAMCFTPRKILFTVKNDGTLKAEPYSESAAVSTSGSDDIISTEGLIAALQQFTIKGFRGGFLNTKAFSGFLRDPSAGKSGFEGKGLFLIIVLILIGGIALNLTPCVLPMIPITIAVIGAGSQAKNKGRGMFVGAVYGLAMALTYGILGLVVVVTGTQFGVINSSPLFNIMIAVVFIIMSLAMFDIVQIDFTKFRKNNAGGERGKLLTVFAMGILASLLAGACVAPVVISVVIYAGSLYASGSTMGLLLPFLLGVGMALPWPFAGAGLSFLPKPGKWMMWVKYVFGIFILIMALYYGYTGISLYRDTKVPEVSTAAQTTKNELPWLHSLNEGLIKAADENKPVFIDFWATWCKNCKAMDATTFKDPAVQDLMRKFVLVKYQAEKPDQPETKKMLDYFRIVGLPTYVVLEPK